MERNNHSKMGRFAQCFVRAILAREMLLRRQVVNGPEGVLFIILCRYPAASTFYERLEWLAAERSGTSFEDFMGARGCQGDAQTEMAQSLAGAALPLWLLSLVHDRRLVKLPDAPGKKWGQP